MWEGGCVQDGVEWREGNGTTIITYSIKYIKKKHKKRRANKPFTLRNGQYVYEEIFLLRRTICHLYFCIRTEQPLHLHLSNIVPQIWRKYGRIYKELWLIQGCGKGDERVEIKFFLNRFAFFTWDNMHILN